MDSTNLRLIMYIRKSSESEERQELSIPAQRRELEELAAKRGLIVIGTPVEEAQSAASPGRPLFESVMGMIRAGKADGILCWKLDRLARNPLDGGSIMWALGEKAMAAIVTPERTYTGTGDDKLLMSIIFGMATKYSDDLSVNIRRGNREALEQGFWPGAPKLGYVRDRDTKRLIADPERWNQVRDLWEMLLAGNAPLRILEHARTTQRLTTRRNGKNGGCLIAASGIYRIFSDPFYTGLMIRSGETYLGTHPPMITRFEFDEARRLISRFTTPKSRPKTKQFIYRGLIRCGSCDALVTARDLVNRYGTPYRYYHCCRKEKRYGYCPEPAVQESAIEEALVEFISKLELPATWIRHAEEHLEMLDQNLAFQKQSRRESVQTELENIAMRQDKLRGLLVDEIITRDEYLHDRLQLTEEAQRLREDVGSSHKPGDVEPFRGALPWLNLAKDCMRRGTPEEKLQLVRHMTCNLKLKGKTLLIQAKHPFDIIASASSIPTMCTR